MQIADKDVLTCARASPQDLIGARLVEIPLHKLDCSIDLESSASSSRPSRLFTGTMSSSLVSGLVIYLCNLVITSTFFSNVYF